jgi:hypothetical protein
MNLMYCTVSDSPLGLRLILHLHLRSPDNNGGIGEADSPFIASGYLYTNKMHSPARDKTQWLCGKPRAHRVLRVAGSNCTVPEVYIVKLTVGVQARNLEELRMMHLAIPVSTAEPTSFSCWISCEIGFVGGMKYRRCRGRSVTTTLVAPVAVFMPLLL